MTLFFSPQILKSFGDWIEQLVAESTGKEGKGILPVIESSPQEWEVYGNDRWFVMVRFPEDTVLEDFFQQAREKGYPALIVTLPDGYALGEQMFLWEFATALAGHFLEINPFDQPNVEETKILTRKRIEKGDMSFGEKTLLVSDTLEILPATEASSPQEALSTFFSLLPPHGYIAIQAFLPYGEDNQTAIEELALLLSQKTRCAVTTGFGPRFLHSTGQLHKGDAGNGIFLQLLSESSLRLPIPGEQFDFGLLKKAQALGDREALENRGRPVLTLVMRGGVPKNLLTIRNLFKTIIFPERSKNPQ